MKSIQSFAEKSIANTSDNIAYKIKIYLMMI